MAKTNRERQQKFREKMRGSYKNLRVYLDLETYARLEFIHYCEKITKQDCITQLINEKYSEWEETLCDRAVNAGKNPEDVKQYLSGFISNKLNSYK